MRLVTILILVALAVGALIGLNSFYTVRQDYQALILEFGRPQMVRNEYSLNEQGEKLDEAGLFFKAPWQEVIYLDRKNIGSDIADIEVLASDQRRLTVDAFVRWHITDPLKFYQRLRTEDRAERQLQRFTESAIRDALGKVPVPEIISGQRAQLMEDLRKSVNESLSGTGITIIDVRIRQADLPADVANGVYDRMRTEREQVAQGIRSKGEEAARLIRAKANREATVLKAEARQKSEQIKGDGDAKRNKIYADAYGQDESFFRFQRALIACEESIKDGTQIIVAPDNLDLCKVFIDRARLAGSDR